MGALFSSSNDKAVNSETPRCQSPCYACSQHSSAPVQQVATEAKVPLQNVAESTDFGQTSAQQQVHSALGQPAAQQQVDSAPGQLAAALGQPPTHQQGQSAHPPTQHQVHLQVHLTPGQPIAQHQVQLASGQPQVQAACVQPPTQQQAQAVSLKPLTQQQVHAASVQPTMQQQVQSMPHQLPAQQQQQLQLTPVQASTQQQQPLMFLQPAPSHEPAQISTAGAASVQSFQQVPTSAQSLPYITTNAAQVQSAATMAPINGQAQQYIAPAVQSPLVMPPMMYSSQFTTPNPQLVPWQQPNIANKDLEEKIKTLEKENERLKHKASLDRSTIKKLKGNKGNYNYQHDYKDY